MADLKAGLLGMLTATATPLPDGTGLLVAEPVVKSALLGLGVLVPPAVGVAPDAPSEDFRAALAAVGEPAVLKAHGEGIVHKTEFGAVTVGVTAASLDAAVTHMRGRIAGHGLTPAGFLVEQLVPTGVEVLVGVVNSPSFGPVLALGLGGTNVEVLDEVVTRLCPITRADAWAMVTGFRGARLLETHRGRPAADTGSLVELLLAVAGEDGLVARLGPALAEFECNPVFVGEHDAVAADARLILRADDPADPVPKPFGLDGLFAPRSVAIAGASATKTTVANRTLRNYTARGWTANLYALHPTAAEVEGVPAYPSPTALPEPVDYLAVMLPAAACPEFVRAAKGRARFVHVLSAGFAETGPDGARLQDELMAAVRDSAVRLIGPNSLGVFSPASGQTWGAGIPSEAGRVGGVFQSGGVATSVLQVAPALGVRFGKAVSTGNGVDVTVGEVAAYLLDDPETDVIALYLEGGGDRQLIDTLRRARGRKPVIILAPGLTAAGAKAAASHTGALTGGRRTWAAVAASTGAAVTETVEDFVAVLAQASAHCSLPVDADPSVLIVGNGGGASVLAVDACDAAGLTVPPCAAAAEALQVLGLDAGTSVANPVDIPIFQGSDPALPANVVRTALTAQAYSDVLLHLDLAPYYALGTYRADLPGVMHVLRVAEALTELASEHRVCLVARNLDCATDGDLTEIRAAFRAAAIPLHRTFAEATRAIAAVQRFHADAQGGR